MAQTTGAMSATGAKVEVSVNGSSWTDISGSSNSVDAPEATRNVDSVFTHSEDTAIITSGKQNPIDVTVSIVYTETAAEGWETIRAQHKTTGAAGGTLYFRYSPNGGGSGDFLYTGANGSGTTAAGKISSLTYPVADTGGGGPVLGSFTVQVPALVKSTIA